MSTGIVKRPLHAWFASAYGQIRELTNKAQIETSDRLALENSVPARLHGE